MPLRPDGPSHDHRPAHILQDALKAQLKLLDGYFPLQGWIVARRDPGEFSVLAAHGAWCRKGDQSVMDEVMHGHWAIYSDHPGFQCRALSDSEKVRFNEVFSASPGPDCIIRRPLRDLEGIVQAWLVGIANQQAVNQVVGPDFQAEHITHAAASMTLSISLHTELESLQNQLTELRHNAFIEPLTGVLNRAGWMNRVQHLEDIMARSDEDAAIVMLDLDLLKLVNDLDGHSAGDELLQLTAQTIQSVVRRSDVVGRLGGDEFGVAVRGVTLDLAQTMINRLRGALHKVGVNVSIGMAMKSEAGNLDDALSLADRRMYEEKRSKPVPERAMKWQRGVAKPNQPLDSRV